MFPQSAPRSFSRRSIPCCAGTCGPRSKPSWPQPVCSGLFLRRRIRRADARSKAASTELMECHSIRPSSPRDPEHPRFTADVAALLGGPAETIAIPDAASLDDLDRIARSQGEQTLAAGAADFFAALLRRRGYSAAIHRSRWAAPGTAGRPGLRQHNCLDDAEPRVCSAGLPVLSLDSSGTDLLDRGTQMLESHGALVLALAEIVATPDQRSEAFDRFTAAAAELICRGSPATILAEGGATAAALAGRLGWTRLAPSRLPRRAWVSFALSSPTVPPAAHQTRQLLLAGAESGGSSRNGGDRGFFVGVQWHP